MALTEASQPLIAGAVRWRVGLLGCRIDPLTLSDTVDEVDRIVQSGERVQHCAINASKVVMLQHDSRLRGIIADCGLVNADGQSVVWASKLLGTPLPARVAGIDLFEALLGLAAHKGYSVYFLGARASVLEAVVSRATREHAQLRIAGSYDGYFADEETRSVAERIRAAAPSILFVGMPSPRKEYWLAENLQTLNVPFSMGVGGSFDVYAGVVKRAPPWMRRDGLEWSFRLLQEPRRLWKRYLLSNIQFAWLVGKELVAK